MRVTSARRQSNNRVTSAPERLRIVVVSDAIAGRNGVGTYYADLADHLRDRVERIDLVTPELDRSRDASLSQLEWFSLPMPGDRTQRLAFPRPGNLQRVLEKLRPNVMVLPTLGAYTLFGARAASRMGIPICAAHHTNFEKLVELYWPWMFASAARKVLHWLSYSVIKRCEIVTAMNYESLEDAKRGGALRTRMVGTPLAKCFLNAPLTERKTPPRRVAYIGRLSPEKRIDLLLAAARALPQFQFTIAGDGPLRDEVAREARAADNVDYRGWVNREEVLRILDACDILTLPSALETFGTVALEALARQRYVVVSRDCGISDWPDLAQGLFTIPQNESLEGTLLRVSSLPAPQRDTIAARGWQSVKHFNQDSVQTWLDVLSEVAASRGTQTKVLATA
ncbi:MAG: glycosyltransferase [Planctomycetota bacterium]